MTPQQRLISLAMAGSAALLAGAFAFQYIGLLAPCTLCLWQRWPHGVAVIFGLLALWLGGRILPLLGAAAAATTAGIAAFHVGVEQTWWEGLRSCSAGSIEGISTADLLNPAVIVAAPVRCDAIAWALMGVSMAGWNMILSAMLVGIWLLAARRS